MSTEPTKNVKNQDVAAKGAAAANGADEFHDFELSRPQFRPGECEGTVQGKILGVLGPFNPGKNSVNNQPWYAYAVLLTAPCEGVDANGNKIKVPPGKEIMVAITAQTRNLAPYALDPKHVHEFRLTPGPAPKAGQMRLWKAQKGPVVERTTKFPLLSPGAANALALLPPAQTDGEGPPF